MFPATPNPSPRLQRPPQPLNRVTGGHALYLREAEDLLDWLEAHGLRGGVRLDQAGRGFTVVCEPPYE